jgi:hypothetical protein
MAPAHHAAYPRNKSRLRGEKTLIGGNKENFEKRKQKVVKAKNGQHVLIFFYFLVQEESKFKNHLKILLIGVYVQNK